MVLFKRLTGSTLAPIAFIVAAALTWQTDPAEAQVQLKIEGDAFMVGEIGATIVKNNDNLEVVFVLPEDNRPEAYKSVDIREKDLILMINGKKVTSVSDIREVFDGIKPGEDVKIGLKRDKSMMIVSFERADPESLPKFKTMTFTSTDTGDGEPEGGEIKMVKMMDGSSGNEDKERIMLQGSGLVIGESDEGLAVAMVMPDASERLGSAEVKKGDRLIGIQGKKHSGLADLARFFEEIEVGTEITLELSRDDHKYSVTFEKAQMRPKTIIMNK